MVSLASVIIYLFICGSAVICLNTAEEQFCICKLRLQLLIQAGGGYSSWVQQSVVSYFLCSTYKAAQHQSISKHLTFN